VSRERSEIAAEFTWNLDDIFTSWEQWDAARALLESRIDEYAALKGTLAQGADRILKAFELNDDLGKLAYTVYFYPSLRYDEDQRDNSVNARRQQVQALMARWQEATAWFNPELLTIPIATIRQWINANPTLLTYQFSIEEVFRLQEHVLDEKGEHLLSLSSRLSGAPGDSYSALSTADAKFPEVELSPGEKVVVSYGQYRPHLATNPNQTDPPPGSRRP